MGYMVHWGVLCYNNPTGALPHDHEKSKLFQYSRLLPPPRTISRKPQLL